MPPGNTTDDQSLKALNQLIQEAEKKLAEAANDPQMATMPQLVVLLQSQLDQLKLQRDLLTKNFVEPGVLPPGIDYVPFALPESRNAVLLSAFVGTTADRSPLLAGMLTARGYQVAPQRQLTLATLRNLPGQNIGVLHLFTHATSVLPGSEFCIATQESPRVPSEETPSNMTLLKQDLHAQDRAGQPLKDDQGHTVDQIIRPTSHNVLERDGNGRLNPSGPDLSGYAARMAFFRKYWSDPVTKKALNIFSGNSVVLISACDVVEPEFLDLLLACGAGTVLAWTDDVAADLALDTASHLFDRLLGANRPEPFFFPEKLRQRPFRWGQVAQDRQNHTTGRCTLGGPYTNDRGKKAILVPYCASGCMGPMLAPSIENLRVDEAAKQLVIEGEFGPDLGRDRCQVLICDQANLASGKPLDVVKWDATKARSGIACVLPSSSGGAGVAEARTAGYVVVVVDGRWSNAVPLTEWRGSVVATAKGKDSLQEICTLNFSIRMDAHFHRTLFTVALSGAPGHTAAVDVLTAYGASYLLSSMALLVGHPSASCTLGSEASGSDQYNPPISGVIKLARQGTLTFHPTTFNPADALKNPENYFDLTLEILRHVTKSTTPALPFSDKHDLTLNIVLPASSGIRETTTRAGTPPVDHTDGVSPVWFGGAFGQHLAQALKTQLWSLPSSKKPKPGHAPQGFKTFTLGFSAETRFPPDLTKGEDYFPAGG